jgi:hypothetical protein
MSSRCLPECSQFSLSLFIALLAAVNPAGLAAQETPKPTKLQVQFYYLQDLTLREAFDPKARADHAATIREQLEREKAPEGRIQQELLSAAKAHEKVTKLLERNKFRFRVKMTGYTSADAEKGDDLFVREIQLFGDPQDGKDLIPFDKDAFKLVLRKKAFIEVNLGEKEFLKYIGFDITIEDPTFDPVNPPDEYFKPVTLKMVYNAGGQAFKVVVPIINSPPAHYVCPPVIYYEYYPRCIMRPKLFCR